MVVPLNVDDGTNNPSNTGIVDPYTFDVQWNTRDNSFYFDLYDPQGNAIVSGIRIVLGAYLGHRSKHPFFQNGVLVAIDKTGKDQECGFYDLNQRVILVRFTLADIMAGTGNYPGQFA